MILIYIAGTFLGMCFRTFFVLAVVILSFLRDVFTLLVNDSLIPLSEFLVQGSSKFILEVDNDKRKHETALEQQKGQSIDQPS